MSDNNSVEKVEKLLSDFADKLENSKNHAAQDMLDAIREQQTIISPLTKLGKEVIDSISNDILNPELEISIDMKLFALKTISDYSTKHLQAVTNVFKADGQTSSEKKQKLAKPGVNSLLDETTNSIISKEQIKDAKEINKSLQESKSLQEHVTSTTNLIKEFNEEHPEENN